MAMGKGKSGKSGEKEGAQLRKSLLSIGADKKSAEKLLSSRALGRVVIPVYWKDGLVSQAHALWLPRLPSFLRSFEREFPDGEVRWDPDYDEQNPQDGSGEYAIRVFFNYQEDDEGDHWSPKPTVIEEQSYQKILERSSYTGPRAVQASTVLRKG
jgi:hypothetical protein